MKSKGFTLLEVVVALTILGISLAVLFEILNQSLNSFSGSRKNFETFLCLDSSYKLHKTEKLSIMRKQIENYRIAVKIYKCKKLQFIEVE